MSFYLVDYENAKNLSGISKLSPDDHVIIFYSKNAGTLNFDTHKEILSSKAHIEYKCVELGKNNALDFQLDSYLGYVICQNENSDCKYYIVAKDKGYSCVTAFWKKEKSLDIQIISDLTGNSQSKSDISSDTVKDKNTTKESPKPVKAKQKTAKKSSASENKIENLLKKPELGLKNNEIKKIIALLETETTQTFNSELNKLLKNSTKAGEIIKFLKPYIKNKPSN